MSFFTKTTESEARRRLTLCESCPTFIRLTRQCNPFKGGCGCFVDLKTPLANESCPRGLWLAVEEPGRTNA